MVNDYEVHMGGRTYNPILGRFMQADPFVQAPANLQNYNRYSYVLNNPMSYTDPSGYNFVKKALKTSIKITGMHAALRALAKNKYLNMAVQAGVCFYGGPVACGAYSGAQTFAVTGSLRAGVKSGLITYGTALAFQEIGNQFSDASMSNIGDALGNNGNFSGLVEFGGNLLTGGQVAAQISLHALVGGIGASLQGGNFGHGFFSAGVTKGAGGAWLPGGGNLSGGQVAYGAVVSAVIGGTASVIAGGKFENGAKTAVFQYLYNQVNKWSYEEQAKRRNLKQGISYIMVGQDSEKTLGREAFVPRDLFTVLSHGSEDGGIEFGPFRLNIDAAAENVKIAYQVMASPNQQVMLLVCNSGTNGFAQHLANVLNVVVIAPSIGNVQLHYDGRFGVRYGLVNPKAYWQEFAPQPLQGK